MRHLWGLTNSPRPLTDDRAPAALAETLLAEWEAHARPATTAAYVAARAGLLPRLTAFCALLLRPYDLNVDPEDARSVLRHATAFRLGCAATFGPHRATGLPPLLTADLHLLPPVAPPAGLQPIGALLSSAWPARFLSWCISTATGIAG